MINFIILKLVSFFVSVDVAWSCCHEAVRRHYRHGSVQRRTCRQANALRSQASSTASCPSHRHTRHDHPYSRSPQRTLHQSSLTLSTSPVAGAIQESLAMESYMYIYIAPAIYIDLYIDSIYTVGYKKRAPKLLSITLAVLNRFR